jgi:hypothetical protein
VHRHDGTVFKPEAFHLVGDDIQPGLASLAGDGFGEGGIARQIVAQILDHVRRLVACERAAMLRIGIDVVAEVGKPVGIEHDEGPDTAFPGTAAEFAQGAHRAFPRRSQRTSLELRHHQRRHVTDLGGKSQRSHRTFLPLSGAVILTAADIYPQRITIRSGSLSAADHYPQRIACAIRNSSMIDTLPFPASIWAM